MATITANQGPAAKRPTLSLPVKRAHQVVGVENAAPQVPDTPKEVVYASEKDLLNGLTESHTQRVSALHIELAVCFLYFASQKVAGDVSKDIKKQLYPLYNQAGYECLNTTDPQYKTVARRIGAAADLYKFVGGEETVSSWVEDVRPRLQVGEVVNHLEEFNLTGVSSIAELVGKEQRKGRGKAKAEDSSDGGSQQASQKQEAAGAPQQGDAEAGSNKQQAQPSAADRAAMSELSQPSAKASVQGAQQEQRNRRANDNLPADRVFVRGHMKVIVPFEATADEVEAAATFLNMVAQRLKLDSLIGSTH